MGVPREAIEFLLQADISAAQGNVQNFRKEFVALLESLGRAPEEFKAIAELDDALRKGQVSLEQLPPSVRALVGEFGQLRDIAKSRDILGIVPHDEINQRIASVRGAFDTLKNSGKLSQVEIAQASLQTQQKILALERSTNGWSDALAKARSELLTVAAKGAGLGLAINAAIDFETALANVRKVLEATPEQLDQLARRMQQLSTELPISAEGLLKIAAAGAQLGVGANDIEQFVVVTAKIATAFSITAEEAGQAVAKLSNVFGLTLSQTAALADSINVLGNTTAASEAQILEFLTRVGGTATQFGLAAKEAAALGAAMISLGQSPETAARAVNKLLQTLQTGNVQSAEVKKGLAELGLQADQFAQQISANPQQALRTFLRTLKDLDAQSRAEILSRIFGTGFSDEISTLVGSLGQFEQALGRVSDQTQVAGSLNKEYEARLQTTQAQIDLLKNSVNNAAVNLGAVFLPAVVEAARGLTDVANAIAGFEEQFPKITALIASLGVIAGSVGALKLAFAAMELVAVNGFTKIAAFATAANAPIGTAIGTVGKLNSAFALLSAGVVGLEIGSYLRNEFEGVRLAGVYLAESLTKAFEFIRFAWEAVKAAFTDDTIEAAQARLKQRLAEIDEQYAEVFDAATDAAIAQAKAADEASKTAAAQQEAAAATATAQQQAAAGAAAQAAAQEEATAAVEGTTTATVALNTQLKVQQDNITLVTEGIRSLVQQADARAAAEAKVAQEAKKTAAAVEKTKEAARELNQEVAQQPTIIRTATASYEELGARARQAVDAALRQAGIGAHTISLAFHQAQGVQASYHAELHRLELLLATLTEAQNNLGDVGVSAFGRTARSTAEVIASAERALHTFSLLDDQDLGRLRGAIDKTSQRLDRLRERAQDVAASIRDELDQVRGNFEELERRNFEERRRELQDQLKEARVLLDHQSIKTLQQALQDLEELEKVRIAEARQREQEQRQREQREQEQRQREQREQEQPPPRRPKVEEDPEPPRSPRSGAGGGVVSGVGATVIFQMDSAELARVVLTESNSRRILVPILQRLKALTQ